MMSRGDEHDGLGRVPATGPSGHVDDWAEMAVDYLDGRLAPEAKAAVQSHLQGCPDCAARLRTQHSVVAFLQETHLDDPPMDLEDLVLGEILFPSQPVSPPRVEEPRGWSATWNKRVRPWLPATIAVIALMAAVTGYGLIQSSDDDLSTEGTTATRTVAIATDQAASETAAPEETLGAPSTTAAAFTTTVAPAGSTDTTTPMEAAGETEPVVIVDRKVMMTELHDAEAPAYLAFMAAAPGQPDGSGSGEVSTTVDPSTGDTSAGAETKAVSSEQAEDVASQITSLTGLTPLDPSVWLGGPTFAAYLPRDDAEQLVDLVRSIGASVGLVVGLILAPPAGATDASDRLLEHKRELCELVADRTPKPAVANWSFTTSTLLPSEGEKDGAEWVPPDEAGTHVLVVIYVQNP